MHVEEALDCDMLKSTLQKRYELTEEGFKRWYTKCRPDDSGETFQQFTSRLKIYITRWIDRARTAKKLMKAWLILFSEFNLPLFEIRNWNSSSKKENQSHLNMHVG